jgi:type IV secretory pathway VirB4 component
MVETVIGVDSWLGSHPGRVYPNAANRRPRGSILTHIIPLSALWAGPVGDEHLGGPPLFFAKKSTPFRLSLHVSDVGHILVVGPTGAGKLVLLALQFRRYEESQVFAFDFGGSIRAPRLTILRSAGGPRSGSQLFFRARKSPLLRSEEHLLSTLCSLALALSRERTLTGLSALLQSQNLKRALQPYWLGGPYGRLLNAEGERCVGNARRTSDRRTCGRASSARW